MTPNETAAIAFLKRLQRRPGRVVMTADLNAAQITAARAQGDLFVDLETDVTWAIVPWQISIEKDREREGTRFKRAYQAED